MDRKDEIFDYVVKSLRKKAAVLATDASFNGERGDGGASIVADKLEAWMDGVNFAHTGKSKMFGYLVKQFDRDRDPEYAEYLRLKQRFE